MTNSSSPEKSANEVVDPDLYIADFVEMLRDVLRAIAADDNSRALAHSSTRLRNLIAHAHHLSAELSWYRILEASVNKLKPAYVDFDAPNAYEHDYDRLAKYGVKLLAESTASDTASNARISSATRAMVGEIKSIAERPKLRRELRDSGAKGL